MQKLKVHYHKKGILVVEKPSGLATQPTRDNQENLFALLQKEFSYVSLHHRLDTPVSGLLLLCTQRRWNKAIAQAFQKRQIQRQYWAICLGAPPTQGIWSWDLQGKRARTHFRTEHLGEGWSILKLSLETGRTHQIRRHAQLAGHPLIGDRRYGGSAYKLCSRIALHAHTLSFIHPATQHQCTITSPIPKALHQYLPPSK